MNLENKFKILKNQKKIKKIKNVNVKIKIKIYDHTKSNLLKNINDLVINIHKN